MKQLITLFSFLLLVNSSLTAQIDKDFSLVDAHGVTNPPGKGTDLKLLTEYLTSIYDNDIDKVRAIGVWIGNNVSLDIQAAFKQETEELTPTMIINRRVAGPGHHAHLFLGMCQEAEIKCYKVRGYLKDRTYEEEDQFIISNHLWNVVQLDSAWYMVDMAFGSGSISKSDKEGESDVYRWKQGFRSEYFLVHPKDWMMTHLPADPMWQLTHHPMSMETFEKGSEAILDFLASSREDTTLNYEKHVNKYDEIHSAFKAAYTAQHVLDFNPNNHQAITYGNATYAFHLTEGRSKNVQVCRKAEKFYTSALEYAEFYKDDISAMYIQDKTKLVKRHNTISKPNRTHTIKAAKFIEGAPRESSKVKERMSRYEERVKSWEIKAKGATSDDLKEVTKPKKQREESDSLLQINLEIIEQNQIPIKEAMADSKRLRDSTQYFYSKIDSNWNKIYDLKYSVSRIIDLLIRTNSYNGTLKQINAYEKRVDSTKNVLIQGLEDDNDAILETIELLEDQKAVKDSAALAMIKQNKKMVRQNKRLIAEDRGEDAEYEALNELLKEAYQLKNQTYLDKIQYQKAYLKNIAHYKRLASEELEILTEEKKVEDELYEQRAAFIKYLAEKRKAELLALTTKCKERLQIVNKVLRDAQK